MNKWSIIEGIGDFGSQFPTISGFRLVPRFVVDHLIKIYYLNKSTVQLLYHVITRILKANALYFVCSFILVCKIDEAVQIVVEVPATINFHQQLELSKL